MKDAGRDQAPRTRLKLLQLLVGCGAAAWLPQPPCLQQNVCNGGPAICKLNHTASCSWREADASAINEHASRMILCQAETRACAELEVGMGSGRSRSTAWGGCPNVPAFLLMGRMRQLVSLGPHRSHTGQPVAPRPLFSEMPPPKFPLHSVVMAAVSHWGLRSMKAALKSSGCCFGLSARELWKLSGMVGEPEPSGSRQRFVDRFWGQAPVKQHFSENPVMGSLLLPGSSPAVGSPGIPQPLAPSIACSGPGA